MALHRHGSTMLSGSGRGHTQLAVNLLFANNLEILPYRAPPRPRLTHHTDVSTRGKSSKGCGFNQLLNYPNIRIHAVTFECYIMIEYLNIVLFVSALHVITSAIMLVNYFITSRHPFTNGLIFLIV